MAFFNWKRFIFNYSSHSNNQNHKVDIAKNSHTGMDTAGALHKRSSLHNPSPSNHHRNTSLFSSPLNPLSSQYNSYFSSRKNW